MQLFVEFSGAGSKRTASKQGKGLLSNQMYREEIIMFSHALFLMVDGILSVWQLEISRLSNK